MEFQTIMPGIGEKKKEMFMCLFEVYQCVLPYLSV